MKYDDSDVTNTLTVTPDEATGKKTYDVPEGAEVTVTLDKALIPAGNVFDGWSTTGNLSLLTGQDYKAESITFTMSSGVDIAAQYRDAATVTIEGLENAVIKEGESKDFTVKVDPKDDAKLGEAFIDFGDKNSEIEYQDKNGEYKPMPEGGLPIDLSDVKEPYAFRIAPKETGKQTLTAAVKKGENELAKDEKDFVVSEMPILTLKDGVITSVTVPGKDGADPEDITEIVKKNANEDGSFNVPEGATVSVAFDKDAFADSGLKFGHWDITGLDDPNAYDMVYGTEYEYEGKTYTIVWGYESQNNPNTTAAAGVLDAFGPDSNVKVTGKNIDGTDSARYTVTIYGALREVTDPVIPTNPEPETPEDSDPTPPAPTTPTTPAVQDARPTTPAVEQAVAKTTPAPETPVNPPVQDARPESGKLIQTGTTNWMADVLVRAGGVLLAAGYLLERKRKGMFHKAQH